MGTHSAPGDLISDCQLLKMSLSELKEGFYCIWSSPPLAGSRCVLQAGFELTVLLTLSTVGITAINHLALASPCCLPLDRYGTVDDISFKIKRKVRTQTKLHNLLVDIN